jgi:hypothetical protein
VSLLVGALGIYVAARLVAGRISYEHAIVTALIGAAVWGLAAMFLTTIPLVGAALPLLAWVWVVKWRYRTGWVQATIIGFLAWAVVVLLFEVLPVSGLDAIGVPFV